MERLIAPETEDTRLTQQELELVLNRWREEKENTVSVADVAEALHCSKAEIEALVWRARAEGVHKPVKKMPQVSVPAVMLLELAAAFLFLLFGWMAGGPDRSSGFFEISAILFVIWIFYASVFAISEAWNRRR